jgi:DNA mismatch endonuclease (patch repair protein)
MVHRHGFRFRLHRKGLPGKPDLFLARYKLCIFVHGCFWHRHRSCKFATTPKSRESFWQAKFAQNFALDSRNKKLLLDEGWRVFELWECGIRGQESNLIPILNYIRNFDLHYLSWPENRPDDTPQT